jgi:hypothetical protein
VDDLVSDAQYNYVASILLSIRATSYVVWMRSRSVKPQHDYLVSYTEQLGHILSLLHQLTAYKKVTVLMPKFGPLGSLVMPC